MSKNKKTKNFYSYDKILSYGCKINVVYGERRNGKTYGALNILIDGVENGGNFVYVRRRATYAVKSKIQDLFCNHQETALKKLNSEIKYNSVDKQYYIETDGGKQVIGYSATIEQAMDYKGSYFKNIKYIYFDEFVDYNYFDDEIKRFLNLVKTITSNKQDIIIIMNANTVNKDCPYFTLFGIDTRKLKKGSIATIYHKAGASVAVEYTKERVSETGEIKKDSYIGFDTTSTVNMIIRGEWETNDYNITSVDGIGWNVKERYILPFYITYLGNVFEISVYKNSFPIIFVRDINTQNGITNKYILFNVGADNTVKLYHNDGTVVPYISKLKSLFIPTHVKKLIDILVECVRTNRIIFNNMLTGTEFINAFHKIL